MTWNYEDEAVLEVDDVEVHVIGVRDDQGRLGVTVDAPAGTRVFVGDPVTTTRYALDPSATPEDVVRDLIEDARRGEFDDDVEVERAVRETLEDLELLWVRAQAERAPVAVATPSAQGWAACSG